MTLGEALPIHHGAQGGFHVWTSLRCRGIALGHAHTAYGLRDAATGATLAEMHVRVDLAPAGGWDEYVGLPAFLLEPPSAPTRDAVLWATVHDDAGASASDEVAVTLVDDR